MSNNAILSSSLLKKMSVPVTRSGSREGPSGETLYRVTRNSSLRKYHVFREEKFRIKLDKELG
jgi:hypothetical protein